MRPDRNKRQLQKDKRKMVNERTMNDALSLHGGEDNIHHRGIQRRPCVHTHNTRNRKRTREEKEGIENLYTVNIFCV